MGKTLKQHWDAVFSGTYLNASDGSSHSICAKAYKLEDNFIADKNRKITNISMKVNASSTGVHQVYLFTLKDSKIFYVSNPITPVAHPESGGNLLSVDTDIDITTEMGYFCLAFSPSGRFYNYTVATSSDEEKELYGNGIIDGTGAAKARVGNAVTLRYGLDYTAKANCFGVKLELDGGEDNNEDDGNSKCDCIFKKFWQSSQVDFAAGSVVKVQHGLDLELDKAICDVRLQCVKADAGYNVGDFIVPFTVEMYEWGELPARATLLQDKVFIKVGDQNTGFIAMDSNGKKFRPSNESWQVVFRIWYRNPKKVNNIL